jgi:hypothetical protein
MLAFLINLLHHLCCFHITTAEVSSCNRDDKAPNPKIFTIWTFTEKIYQLHPDSSQSPHMVSGLIAYNYSGGGDTRIMVQGWTRQKVSKTLPENQARHGGSLL